MIIPVVIGIVFLYAVLSSYLFWSRRARSATRVIGVPPGQPVATFSGGVLCRAVSTTDGLARLELFDWGVRVCGAALTRWMVPTWEARYEELTARRVTAQLSRDGIWLRVRGEPQAIVFFTGHGDQILAMLNERGGLVDSAIARLRRLADIYQIA